MYPTPGPPLVSGRFQLFGEGMPLGWCKKVSVPLGKIKRTTVQAAGNAMPTHYPSGMGEIEELDVSMFEAADGTVRQYLQTWRKQCINTQTGKTSATPEAAKRELSVVIYDLDGTEKETWKLSGCFPTDLGKLELEAGKEDALVPEMKFSLDSAELV